MKINNKYIEIWNKWNLYSIKQNAYKFRNKQERKRKTVSNNSLIKYWCSNSKNDLILDEFNSY